MMGGAADALLGTGGGLDTAGGAKVGSPSRSVGIPQDYNQLDRQIDAVRKQLIRLQQAKQQMLQGTKGYTGGADYSKMMQPVQQQHL